jgi:hypothetical protein
VYRDAELFVHNCLGLVVTKDVNIIRRAKLLDQLAGGIMIAAD